MSSPTARFLFIFLFVIHCLLWSQSRYAHLPQPSLHYREKSLVKRISDELLNRDAVSTVGNFGNQVHSQIHAKIKYDVHQFLVPTTRAASVYAVCSCSEGMCHLTNLSFHKLPSTLLLYKHISAPGGVLCPHNMACLPVFDLGNKCLRFLHSKFGNHCAAPGTRRERRRCYLPCVR